MGELAARMDARERRRREEEAAWKEEREQMEVLEGAVAELCEITEALARATLVASGYHRHRGQWRRRRVSPKKKQSAVGTPAKTDRTPKETLPKTEEGLLELARRAQRGDETAMPKVKELLDFGPELVSAYGGLARQAEWELICATAGKDLLLREAVWRKLKEMRKELAGSSPSPLERLLAERVARPAGFSSRMRSCTTPAIWEASR